VIISGPCSAESGEQILETARELAGYDIHIFRAGIWKPRTRPDCFEGVGTLGLEWLQQVKKETGMYVTTEVANVKHVYEAVKYGIDILWIGARTTVNPFAVQEIADSLRGMDIPVMVKNPVNPDIELWMGAIERFSKAGIKRIAAIHRGFSSYEKGKYRNPPQWQVAIELKRRLPGLPVLCDPSHMAGNTRLLKDISQKALDLDYDGLMIESHNDPANALSDAAQQITPSELNNMLSGLVLRNPDADDQVFMNTLEELRGRIDRLDNELVDILEHRMRIADTIGEYKKRNNVTILQSKRWDEIVKHRVEKGMQKGLSSEFMHKLLKAIHQESINHQNIIMNREEVVGNFCC